jgi:hypothetical protein
VRTELKLFDIAADALGRFVGIKSNLAIHSRLAQNTGRRFRAGVANKKDRMLRILN